MALRGSSLTKKTRFGVLKAASCARAAAIIAASSPSPITTATTASPKSGCGTPITALSVTPPISSRISSISLG